jgi:hypothetical protein
MKESRKLEKSNLAADDRGFDYEGSPAEEEVPPASLLHSLAASAARPAVGVVRTQC